MVNSRKSAAACHWPTLISAAVLSGLWLWNSCPAFAAGRPAPAPPGVIIEPPAPPPQAAPDDDEADEDTSEPRGLGCPANQRPLELLV